MANYLIGVDVGTTSARAGIFDSDGHIYGAASRDISLYRPQADYAEQSSQDIWQAVCAAVREALRQAAIDPALVSGIGFDATCSLVALDSRGQPLTISPSGRAGQNVIVWMDHRAIDEAARINATHHPVLDYVGGVISPEMQTPKLLWLKQHLPETWAAAGYFFDLPDFLTWCATGNDARSQCSVVCKWTWDGLRQRWDSRYFETIGLEDLLDDGALKIGRTICAPGSPLAAGLTEAAAAELGLRPGTAVGTSLIDAHAGMLATLGIEAQPGVAADYNRRIALIGGTSSCHMALAPEPRFISGVWGPYYGAVLPGLWLNEGGQSATGALIDHIIRSHPCFSTQNDQAKRQGMNIYQRLNALLTTLAGSREAVPLLTRDIHVLPYFHGNRSPRADPTLSGAIVGLHLSQTPEDLALLYLATVQAIALGTRHIVDTLNQQGYAIDTLVMSGGGIKNPLFLQAHADATGCKLLLAEESEAMLLGSAMLASVAAGVHASLPLAMQAMSRVGQQVRPDQSDRLTGFYAAKYRVFHQLYHDSMRYRQLMDGEEPAAG